MVVTSFFFIVLGHLCPWMAFLALRIYKVMGGASMEWPDRKMGHLAKSVKKYLLLSDMYMTAHNTV